MIRRICRARGAAPMGRWIRGGARRSSTSSSAAAAAAAAPKLVSLDADGSTGIATLTMQNPPVNSLSLEMNVQLAEAIRTARQDPNVQALVLASSNPKIFSAGLDLNELYPQPSDTTASALGGEGDGDDEESGLLRRGSRQRLIRFWKSFQQVYLELYNCRLAVVAAIEGHAVAGGCMLALSADYRVMADSPRLTIGLNEALLGIAAPPWMGQQLVDTVGRRAAELGLARGTLWNPHDALALRLVDEVVPGDRVREAAQRAALEFARIPASARAMSKGMIRGNRVDRLAASRQEDVDNFLRVVTSEQAQKRLEAYLASLAKKK